MQPIHWIKNKYKRISEHKSIFATIKDFFRNFKPNLQKLLFKLRHLDESNENLAYYHFERGNFNDAILRFKIIKRINKMPVYDFFLGRVYWEKRKNEKAIEHLDEYLKSGDSEFQEEAIYCKKLATLNESDIESVPLFLIHHNYNKFYFIFQKEFLNSMHYEPKSPFFNVVKPIISKHFPKTNALRVLDVGCADGVLGYCCKQEISSRDIIGIELVDRLASLAEERNHNEFKVYSKVIRGDFFEISKSMQDSFDLILAENFVSYRVDIEDILQRLKAYLGQGGLLIFSFVETKKYDKSEFLIDEEDFAFNIEYVRKIIKNNGMKVEAQDKVEYSPDNINIVMVLSHAK